MSLRFLQARGGGTWTPRALSSVTLWLDSQDASTISTDATYLYWVDKIASRTFSGVKTNTTYDGTINGYPAIKINLSNGMTTSAFTAFGTNAGTMFHVSQHSKVSGGIRSMLYSGATNLQMGPIYGDSTGIIYDGATDREYGFSALSQNTPYLSEMLINSTPSNSAIRRNGVAGTLNYTQGTTWNIGQIAAIGTQNTINCTGVYGEIVMCSTELSAGDQTLLRDYMKTKWGISF